jgi:predicted phage baseplate assembly protein
LFLAATRVAATPGQAPDHLFVDFAPALPRPFMDARLHGNIASASHGETQPDEALGHGDASKAFQEFKLSRPDLTYLQSAAKVEGAAALEIRVNGELWSEVPSLYARKANERVYTARQNDSAETFITFGDGKTGARVASGAMNVTARYRKGLGLEGVMKAGQLSIPLERPPGLRAVSNPLPADGAADPETRDGARTAAPNTVRTFGRAVSLADFEGVATASGLAARAFATWVWHELERAVHVSVIGPGGARLSLASLATLHSALQTARDINRPMFLANVVRAPVVVSAKLLRDPAYEADAILEAARAKLLALFAFESMALGEAVFVSAVYAALQSATGVVAADIDVFHLKNYTDLTPAERAIRAVDAGPLQPHIRMFPARPTPPAALIDRFARAGFEGAPPPVLAAEQAFIEAPATDIALTVVEAL